MLPAQQIAKRRIKMAKRKLQDKAEQNGPDLNKALTETAEMQAWSQLTFTCPKCGSDRLLKCLGGQMVYAQVDEIHYKREEWEETDEEGTEAECDNQDAIVYDDVEDAYVVVQSRPDGTEIWDFGVDNASDHHSWFRCAECDYELAFEDGSSVEDDMELAQWLIRTSKKSQ
jgi:transposase-like protein